MDGDRRRHRGETAAWLLLLAAGFTAAFVAVVEVFLHTARGQLVDEAVLRGASIGRRYVIQLFGTVLDAVSLLSLAVATATIGFIALARRRVGLAVAVTAIIAGANLTTQVLKDGVLARPDLAGGPVGAAPANSLPSGHATVAMSVATALVLAVPAPVRGWVAVLGGAYASLTGVATVAAGWHRPSDVVAAYLVVGVWAALAGAALMVHDTRAVHGAAGGADAHPVATTLLAAAGAVLLALSAAGLLVTADAVPGVTARAQLLVAYGAGAAAIAGTAVTVLSALLAVVHRVVPSTRRPTARGSG